jgi:hypothetical protein
MTAPDPDPTPCTSCDTARADCDLKAVLWGHLCCRYCLHDPIKEKTR